MMTAFQAISALRGRLAAWVEFKKVPDNDPDYVKKATELNALITGFNQLENQVKTLTHTVGDLQRKNYALQARLRQADELAQTDWFSRFKELEFEYHRLINLRNGSVWEFIVEAGKKKRCQFYADKATHDLIREANIRTTEEWINRNNPDYVYESKKY